jgi:hypothetical protein
MLQHQVNDPHRLVPLAQNALEHRARRAAHRVGLVATKSRWRRGSTDNHGGFMLIDPCRNFVAAGARFDMTPQHVIEWCGD